LKIGTTGTETSFLPESELPETARLTQTRSDTLMDIEEATHSVGGEDAGLARAIEESMREQQRGSGSGSGPQ